MISNNDERFTYTRFKIETIKDKLMKIEPSFNDVSTVEVMNIALACFSYICDEHINEDVGHGEAVQDIIDNKEDFVNNIKFLIQQCNSTNYAINNVLNKYMKEYDEEVK